MKFPLGMLAMTPGSQRLMERLGQEPIALIRRHANLEAGTLDPEDQRQNQLALEDGGRIMSAFEIHGEPIWVITEADRSVTTILLPEEY